MKEGPTNELPASYGAVLCAHVLRGDDRAVNELDRVSWDDVVLHLGSLLRVDFLKQLDKVRHTLDLPDQLLHVPPTGPSRLSSGQARGERRRADGGVGSLTRDRRPGVRRACRSRRARTVRGPGRKYGTPVSRWYQQLVS